MALGCSSAGGNAAACPSGCPAEKGFGSRLIEAGLEESQMVFAPDGMSCTLHMQL